MTARAGQVKSRGGNAMGTGIDVRGYDEESASALATEAEEAEQE